MRESTLINEEARLIRAAQHDPANFTPLYERYVDRIYAYCARRVSSPQEAEDLCSQVFVQAIRGLHTFTGGVFAAWLFTIARNTVAQHYRQQRSTIIPLDTFDLPDEDVNLDALLDDAEAQRILKHLVEGLPGEKRELLRLVLDSELTAADVGRMTNKSAGAVRVEFHRIVKVLRKRYEQIMGDSS